MQRQQCAVLRELQGHTLCQGTWHVYFLTPLVSIFEALASGFPGVDPQDFDFANFDFPASIFSFYPQDSTVVGISQTDFPRRQGCKAQCSCSIIVFIVQVEPL